MKKSFRYILIALLCMLCLTACKNTEQPDTVSEVPEIDISEIDGMKTVEVSNADEFLAAIDSDTMILMKPGVYDLTDAEDYASMLPFNKNLEWEFTYDGFELNIKGVRNLSILGADRSKVTLLTKPRYATVLRFTDCENISIASVTIGHTEEPGECSGGVLLFDNVEGVGIVDSELYGCGTLALTAHNSSFVYTEGCTLRDCSEGVAVIRSCEDVRFTDCEIKKCGKGYASSFDVLSTIGFALVNCDISENYNDILCDINYCCNVYFLGNNVHGNLLDYMFDFAASDIRLEGCNFTNNSGEWFSEGTDLAADSKNKLTDTQGKAIGIEALENMQLEYMEFTMPKYTPKITKAEGVLNADGKLEYHVRTVDEFIAAIGNDSVIYLENEAFLLSDAETYGKPGGEYYTWEDSVDGFELSLHNLSGLSIIGDGRSEIQASSRWADVLSFNDCENIELIGITAGHNAERGTCSGGVIELNSCVNVTINNCRLYGCGVWGISGYDNRELLVYMSEIYECSSNAVNLSNSEYISFQKCDIHDCGKPDFELYNCTYASYDQDLVDGAFDIEDGKPVQR